ncbi:hypothetical protein KIN34_02390 [Cellulomonas sp. DKR-3]|uniref:Ribosomally synthesized peptide with SipW-like signal peptide n=1 Tax=Cellulomonas fulva TaxID=2835530 RepID=A0ABS5TVK4_9CELL|nr:hypothetical protein [Cellulomonas fulva]MBT0993141.1 hypothetical protein [Cellulomonas fulva]
MSPTQTAYLDERTDERRRKRVAALKITLAGGAILAVGAAATSAAWTDQAWFAAPAAGASFELQGRGFGGEFVDADEGDAIAIPARELADLVPGDSRSFEIDVKNAGSVPMTVEAEARWAASGTGFDGAPQVALSGVPAGAFAADDTATVTVEVTVPDDWPVTNQERSQELSIVFTGTSV